MARGWQLQDAKNRFSELVDRAQTEGPQLVTRHGKEVAVVVSKADFDRQRARHAPRGSVLSFLRGLGFVGTKIDLKRSTDSGRDLEL